MTSTAHEDQFTPEPASTGWTTREMVGMFQDGRTDEREAIAAWLAEYGYREIATRIRAGEHHK